MYIALWGSFGMVPLVLSILNYLFLNKRGCSHFHNKKLVYLCAHVYKLLVTSRVRTMLLANTVGCSKMYLLWQYYTTIVLRQTSEMTKSLISFPVIRRTEIGGKKMNIQPKFCSLKQALDIMNICR